MTRAEADARALELYRTSIIPAHLNYVDAAGGGLRSTISDRSKMS